MSDTPIPQQTITIEDSGLPPASAYFLSLTLENVRCFSTRQTLDLSDGNGKPCMWNVLLGENGTGKTSLLIGLASSIPYEKHVSSSSSSTGPTEISVFSGLINKDHKVPIKWKNIGIGHFSKLDQQNVLNLKSYILVEYNNIVNMNKFSITIASVSHADGVNTMMDYMESQNYLPDNFMISSYGGSRLLDDKALSDSSRPKRLDLLLNPLIPLPNAEEWLVQSDYAAKLEPDNPKPKQRLDMVKNLLCAFLPDVEDFKFGIAPGTTMTPRVEAKTPYGWVRVRDLSLGYQTALAWIVDFASRMMDRYPDSENPFAEPAICLVDEIDLHTHPKWQKELVHTLRRLFPKTQFIVTAHSPLIVQAAEDANIALLRREGDHVVIENDVDYIRNWRVDQILSSELFSNVGGESALSERLMAERTKLVEKGAERAGADEVRLREIDAELDKLPSGSTSQDREAMELIRDAAQWLKAAPKA